MDTIGYIIMLVVIVVLVACVIGLSNRADYFEGELAKATDINGRLLLEYATKESHHRVLRSDVDRLRQTGPPTITSVDAPIPFVLPDKVEHYN